MIKSACFGCKKRTPGCHGRCRDYEEYNKARAALRQEQFLSKLTTTARKTTAKVNTFSRKLYTE